MEAIDHVRNTGSSLEVTLEFVSDNIIINPEDNAIIFRTETLVPIIGSYDWVPVSSNELPLDNQLIHVNTSFINNTPVFNPGGQTGDIHIGNTSPNNTLYNVTIYLMGSKGSSYDYACMYAEPGSINDCDYENNTITKNGIDYKIEWIDESGNEIIFSGPKVEKYGALGVDPAGVVIGKSQSISDKQHVELRLVYRGLIDSSGRIHKTYITCSRNCQASAGRRTLMIRRDRVERTSNFTNFYIDLSFD